MRLGQVAARAVIGGLFIGHGTQKLFGWFGGPGQAGTEQMMGALGMHPTKHNALAAGVTEAAGGALLVAGAGTPLAAAGLIGTMITAIRKVHLPNGPWVTNGGYEYNAVLIAALLALVDGGPGELSVDHTLGLDDTDWRWAAGALALGAAASAVAVELGRRHAPAEAGSDYPAERLNTSGDPVTAETGEATGG